MIVIHVLAPHTFIEKSTHTLRFMYDTMFKFVKDHATRLPGSVFRMNTNVQTHLLQKHHRRYRAPVVGGSDSPQHVPGFKAMSHQRPKQPDTFVPDVYPEDTIMELKRKIAEITKIATYRQHLYVTAGAPRVLLYKVSIGDKPYTINIHDTQSWDLLENVPINSGIYSMRDNIIISAGDEFEICASLVDRMHKNRLDLYLVDLQDYICPAESKSQRLAAREHFERNISSNPYYIDLIYTSFVQLFYPSVTRTAFSEFISSGLVDIIPRYISLRAEKELLDVYHTRAPPYPDVSTAITYCKFTVMHNMLFTPSILFDILRITNTITQVAMCQSRIIIKYRSDSVVIPVKPKPSQVVVNIMTKRKAHAHITLIIDSMRYMVISSWPEHKFLMFRDIIKLLAGILNPVLGAINRHGGEIFNNMPMMLPNISEYNVIQNKTAVSIIWPVVLLGKNLAVFLSLLNDWKLAGIVRERQNTTYVREYYLNKGVYMNDIQKLYNTTDIKNTYSYLTITSVYNRWQVLFNRSKCLHVQFRQNSIKFELSNVCDSEFKVYEFYITNLISDTLASIDKNCKDTNNIKKIRRLKENDPIAFGERGYSEACQQNKQPVGYSMQEYNQLSSANKVGKVKYINFTTDQPYYYGCPTKENPYLYFITGVHPDNLCLPCCKSTKTTNTDKLKKYNTCLKTHKYVDADLESVSKYVIGFKDVIPINRLAYLPVDTLALIFHGDEGVIPLTVSAITDYRYYAIGVPQNTASVMRCGVLFCLLLLFDITIAEFLQMIRAFLIKNTVAFQALLDSRINEHYASIDEFIDNMHAVFIRGASSKISQSSKASKWNIIFIEFAEFIFNIKFIRFVMRDEFQLIIPENTHDQYFQKVVILIESGSNFYPVCDVRPLEFMNHHLIRKKVFTATDEVIKNIRLLLPASDIGRTMPISFLVANFKIQTVYVNTIGIAYSVLIDDTVITIADVLYDRTIGSRATSLPVYSTYDQVSKLLASINTKIAEYSAAEGMYKQNYDKAAPLHEQVVPIYNYTEPTDIYVLGKMQVGFIANNIPYFHQACEPLKNIPTIMLQFAPADVNLSLYNHTPPSDIGIAAAIHARYEYSLMLIQYNMYFNNERNDARREEYKNGKRKGFSAFELAILRSKVEYGLPFDRQTYNKLSDMSAAGDKPGITKILKSIGKEIFGQFTAASAVSNTLSVADYTVGGKLMIDLAKLPEYIDILASDLVNPLIGMSVFMNIDRILDERKFSLPAGEKIKFIDIKPIDPIL